VGIKGENSKKKEGEQEIILNI